MTGSQPRDERRDAAPSEPSKSTGPSRNGLRIRAMLRGGLLGSHAAAVLCLIGFGFGYGALGFVSALLAAGLVIFFYTAGHAVQILVADSHPRVILAASVASYVGRISILGGLLLLYLRYADESRRVLPVPFGVTAAVVVIAWLTAEVLVWKRLRIPHFDEPEPSVEGQVQTK